MNVDILDLPERRVAAVTHVGPYAGISQAFARLGEIAGRAGLDKQPDTAMVAIYYDDPEVTPAERLRADAGLVVPVAVTLPAGLTEKRLPAGRYARTLHVGPYETLGGAWARLKREWLPASGHRAGSGAAFERYLNTPMTARPEDLRTELFLPIS